MKKITLLAAVLLASVTMNSQTIAHNDSDEIIGGNSLLVPTETTNYLRVFDLADEFDITTDWTITGAAFGTEVSETADITD